MGAVSLWTRRRGFQLKKVIGIAAIILASALAMPAYGQADPNTHTADAAMDILACSAVSEGLGTYEDFNTEQKTYSDERCDYLMQYYNLVCESFGSGANYCSQGSFSYVKMQSYIAREGLQQNVSPTVIEKTVKVEIEEDDHKDKDHKDRKHHWRGNDPCNYHGLDVCDSNGDCDSERFDCLSDCKDGSRATTGQCPGDDKDRDKHPYDEDKVNDDEIEDEDEEEEEQEEEEPEEEEEEDQPANIRHDDPPMRE
jgi:hypothetical protein